MIVRRRKHLMIGRTVESNGIHKQLYDAIAVWAEDDFRSVNGQIEYLLTECVRQRKKNGKYVSEHMDEPPELDIH